MSHLIITLFFWVVIDGITCVVNTTDVEKVTIHERTQFLGRAVAGTVCGEELTHKDSHTHYTIKWRGYVKSRVYHSEGFATTRSFVA